MKTKLSVLTLLAACLGVAPLAFADSTAFTWQGKLTDAGQPANGSYDLRFTLHDSLTGGTALGTNTFSGTILSNGTYTATLDFGAAIFNGDARWLELALRTNGAADFTALVPRQSVTPTPYAIWAANAGSATAAGSVTGAVAASQLTGTISSNNISAGSITTIMLASGAVGSDQLAANAVTTAAIQDGAVAAPKLTTFTTASLLLTLTNTTPDEGDYFGLSVAGVSVERLLVGAPYADKGATDSGVVYLFSDVGMLLTTFTNPTPASGDLFGLVVAGLGSNGMLIGAAYDDTGATDDGAAYLFNTNGTLLTTFTNPAPWNSARFGASIAALGNDGVIIGAIGDEASAASAGAAYLFRANGTLLTTFTNPTPALGDHFGYAVAALGPDRVVIGAFSDDTGAMNAGAAYLFSTNGTLLTAFTNPTPAVGDQFGIAVAALGSDRVLIGAPTADMGADDSGAVYLFNTNGILLTTITNPTPAASDVFGFFLAAVGTDRLLISAHSDDTGAEDAGAVYLFTAGGALLTTLTNPASSEKFHDLFGASIAAL